MIHGGDSDAGTTSNRYCERVGLASVPRVEDVLDRDEVTLFHLMVVALLERGRPMTVEEIAERLTEAGAVARSGDMVLSLKKAAEGETGKLTRRLESDVKALCAFYQSGRTTPRKLYLADGGRLGVAPRGGGPVPGGHEAPAGAWA